VTVGVRINGTFQTDDEVERGQPERCGGSIDEVRPELDQHCRGGQEQQAAEDGVRAPGADATRQARHGCGTDEEDRQL
jgi:hypothetical protein